MKRFVLIIICVVVIAVASIYFFTILKKADHRETAITTVASLQQRQEESQTETQEEPPTVEIPLDKQQLLGIKTAVVTFNAMEKTIRTVGKIEYDEELLSTVSTKVDGWIERLHVPYTGAYVEKGQPLADIYSPELWATQQEFIDLHTWARGHGNDVPIMPKQSTDVHNGNEELSGMLSRDSQTLLEAARQRLRLFDIPDGEIKRIEESGKPLRTLTVTSPVNGYVLQKYVVKGTRVMAGEKLLDLADLSRVWVVADVYEQELPFIKVNEAADVTLSAVPGKTISVRIDFISPVLSADTRTAKVRFTIPNTKGQLKPQMFTDVELKTPLGKKLAVPSDAVIDTGLRKIVYVDKGDGYFEPREVEAGARTEKFTEITSGLAQGDKVAVSANFLIDSEAKLKGVEPLPKKGGTPVTSGPTDGQPAAAPIHRHQH